MVVEPVGDALHLQPQLGGEVLHGGGAGVGVQEEGDVESLSLLLGDGGPGLLSSHRASVGGGVAVVVQSVQGRTTVRAAVQPVPSLAGVPVLALGAQQLLNVGRVVEPELHPGHTDSQSLSSDSCWHCLPDERFPALDTEHVPGLGLTQQLRYGALAQSQHALSEQLERGSQFFLSPCAV